MIRAGMQSRAVEGVGMLIGKRAAARGSAGDAEEAGTRLSEIESNFEKIICKIHLAACVCRGRAKT